MTKSNFNDEMSDEQLQEIQERFEDLVSEEDWNGINDMRIDLQNMGLGDLEVKLINSMSEDDLLEYKHWDTKTNGSIETQTDDE